MKEVSFPLNTTPDLFADRLQDHIWDLPSRSFPTERGRLALQPARPHGTGLAVHASYIVVNANGEDEVQTGDEVIHFRVRALAPNRLRVSAECWDAPPGLVDCFHGLLRALARDYPEAAPAIGGYLGAAADSTLGGAGGSTVDEHPTPEAIKEGFTTAADPETIAGTIHRYQLTHPKVLHTKEDPLHTKYIPPPPGGSTTFGCLLECGIGGWKDPNEMPSTFTYPPQQGSSRAWVDYGGKKLPDVDLLHLWASRGAPGKYEVVAAVHPYAQDLYAAVRADLEAKHGQPREAPGAGERPEGAAKAGEPLVLSVDAHLSESGGTESEATSGQTLNPACWRWRNDLKVVMGKLIAKDEYAALTQEEVARAKGWSHDWVREQSSKHKDCCRFNWKKDVRDRGLLKDE